MQTDLRRLGLVPALCAASMLAFAASAQDQAAPAADAPAADAPAEAAPPAPSYTPGVTADTVVASVNGADITVGDLVVAFDGLPDQYKQIPGDVLLPSLIDQLVQQTLLAGAAGEPDRRTQLILRNQERSVMAGAQLAKVIETQITDDAIQAYYNENYVGKDLGTEYNASHILVPTEDEAKAIIDEINGGADFDAVAKEKSTGPSGPNGGNLGWFSQGQMVEPFEQAVMALQPGQISGPVQTQFGWHVIKLNETRAKSAPPLDDVREEIIGALQRQAIEAEITRLTDSATIVKPEGLSIDPALVADPSILQ